MKEKLNEINGLVASLAEDIRKKVIEHGGFINTTRSDIDFIWALVFREYAEEHMVLGLEVCNGFVKVYYDEDANHSSCEMPDEKIKQCPFEYLNPSNDICYGHTVIQIADSLLCM